jgi:hypothetical protein
MNTKIWLIIAAILIILGGIIFTVTMTGSHWDFKNLSSSSYETNTYQISDSFTDVSMNTNTADIRFLPSGDDTTSVVFYESQNERHSAAVVDGILTIDIVDNRSLLDYIGFNFDVPQITVYLPAGEWVDAWTGKKFHSKGETVRHPYPDDRAGLLFIRGGAIVPTMKVRDSIGTEPEKELIVDVYPCGESEYVMLDCDAESYGYEKGLVARTRFNCAQKGKIVEVKVAPVEGTFENMPQSRDYTFRVALDSKPSKVYVDGKKVSGWEYSDGTLVVNVAGVSVHSELTINVK